MVDDESDVTAVLNKGLEEHGFVTKVFNDPQEALTHYKPNSYDIIILDIRMPRMNGFELAKEIWAKDERARICFLTAFEIHEIEAKKVFRNFKAHSFIKKPITAKQLIQHIEANFTKAE